MKISESGAWCVAPAAAEQHGKEQNAKAVKICIILAIISGGGYALNS